MWGRELIGARSGDRELMGARSDGRELMWALFGGRERIRSISSIWSIGSSRICMVGIYENLTKSSVLTYYATNKLKRMVN